MTIIASAPTRIDLAGGTLDLEPLYLFHPNACSVNLAMTLPATVKLTPRRGAAVELIARDRGQTIRAPSWQRLSDGKLPLLTAAVRHFAPTSGFTLETDCSAPAGSGLGGSSSLMVALVAAFRKWEEQQTQDLRRYRHSGESSPRGDSRIRNEDSGRGARMTENQSHGKLAVPTPEDREETLKIAKGIETSVIKVPTGYQDYLAALHGGLNIWHFGSDGIRQEELRLSSGFMKTLERQLLLVYTGVPHFSGMNNWEIFKRHVDGNKKTYNLFEELRDNALVMAQALKSESLPQVARVLQKDWVTRRKLAPTVSTPKIDRLLREGKRAGVIGARICGAGGGGCVALLAKVGKAEVVCQWLASRHVAVLQYSIDQRGLRVGVVKH